MKILHLLINAVDDTANKLIEEQKKSNDVSVINLNDIKNYDEIVDAIFLNDRTISW